MHVLEEVLFFKLHATEKQTINSLSLCRLDAGRLAEGKGHMSRALFFGQQESHALFLPPASQHLTDKLTELIVCSSVFLLYIA